MDTTTHVWKKRMWVLRCQSLHILAMSSFPCQRLTHFWHSQGWSYFWSRVRTSVCFPICNIAQAWLSQWRMFIVVFFLLKSRIFLCKQIFMSVSCVGRSQTLGLFSKSLDALPRESYPLCQRWGKERKKGSSELDLYMGLYLKSTWRQQGWAE